MTKKTAAYVVIGIALVVMYFVGTSDWFYEVAERYASTGECNYPEPYTCEKDIFVGRVLRHVGSTNVGNYRFAQFEVEVVRNIRGELRGTLVLNQSLNAIDGENLLWSVGKEYKFGVDYNQKLELYDGTMLSDIPPFE